MKWNHSQHHWFSQCPTGDGKAGVWIQFPLSPAPVTCPRGTGCCPLTSEQALCLEGWQAHSSCFPSPLSPQQLQARGTAQRRWLTGERVKPILNFRLNSSLPEGKFLQKWGKKNKQLSSGQLFSKAHPLSWKTIKSYLFRWCLYQQALKYFMTSCKTWAKGGPASLWGFMYSVWSQPPGLTNGEGNGDPLQYSCLESPMDGRTWRATVHGVARSRTWLSD